MNKKERINKKNASTKFQRSTPTRALLSIGSQQLSSFTKLSFDGQAKLTGVATPTRDTDVVPLQYLQAHYLSKNDPNPGYIPIHGGNMTGNINMGTHSVFNLKQPEKPKIELPSETDKPKDPREEDGFAEKTAEEQEQEIKEYNTKLAEYQKKIDDYNAAWEAFYSEAATVKYVKGIVDKILNNDKLSTALNSATEVEKKIALAQKALGIEITINPDADTDPEPETPEPTPTADTEEEESPPLSYDDLPSVIKNSQFVVTQSQNNLTGDLKMTNAQIANIKTPVEGESNYAANVTYLESKLQNPKRAFLSNTLPTTTSSPTISFNGYIPWLSTTNGSSSPTEPDFKSKLADQCFDTSSQENLKVKTAGLLVLSVRGTWNPTTATPTDDASTPTPTTISVNLTVTPDNSSGTVTSSSGSGSSEDTSATETLTIPLTLYSGESVQLQLPIKTASDIKMDTSSQTSNGGSGSVSSSATLSSWSWEAALYPTDVTKNTPSTPSSPTDPSPSPTSPGTNTNTEQTP